MIQVISEHDNERPIPISSHDIQLVIDSPNGRQAVLLIDSDAVRSTLSGLIDRSMEAVAKNKRDTKALMMKASINSALIAMGPLLIDLFSYDQSKPKPKPGRKDDLIEWYSRYIVDQLVALLRDSGYRLHFVAGDSGSIDEYTAAVRIIGLYTEPVPGPTGRTSNPGLDD